MSTVDEKLAKSLTAESTELIPYLPYLLQDLWELGSSPQDMIDLITKHASVSRRTRLLDLACGKGAVSVNIARTLGCSVKGIDILPEFIEFARRKAAEYGVDALCEFEVGDINQAVKSETNYDIAILGAVGDVLGSSEKTISLLKNTVKPGGYILIDDGYAKEQSNSHCLTRDAWLELFDAARVTLVDEILITDDALSSLNVEQQECIRKRANELKERLPRKAYLFDSYIASQQAECDELENEISGVTLLLRVDDR